MPAAQKMTMTRRALARALRRGAPAVAAALLAAGCENLDVTNPNNPDRARAQSEPGDVEALIAGSYLPVWSRTQGSDDPAWVLTAAADEFTTTAANFGAWTYSSEPRVAIDNQPTAAFVGFLRNPYEGLYSGLSNVHDALGAINQGMRFVDASGVDNTMRARAFGKFTQGAMLGLIGMLYDRGFVVTERTPIDDASELAELEPVAYAVMRDSAVAQLREAIRLARANTFTLPNTWIPGLALTNADVARLAHAWIARVLAYTPRTPQERQSADWRTIIASTDSAITADFAPIGGPSVLSSQYKRYSSVNYTPTTIIYFADNRLLGPADVSGNYQRWLQTPMEQRQRFEITTPDRRVTGAGGPRTNGKYFRYQNVAAFRADRGTYHASFYQFQRFPGRGGGAYGQDANTPLLAIARTEMDLLKAEGLIRTGNAAAALPLINRSRQTNGELPAATATGVSGADCVPRKADGSCGDLMDVLIYEKRIEQAGTDNMAFYDARGFGLLTKGTFLQLPIPGRELVTLGIPNYTFGGTGPGSAP
jgi:hypothetical protein